MRTSTSEFLDKAMTPIVHTNQTKGTGVRLLLCIQVASSVLNSLLCCARVTYAGEHGTLKSGLSTGLTESQAV